MAQDNMKICICGGGHIAHSLAAVLSQTSDVLLFSRRPSLWDSHIICEKGLAHIRMPKGKAIHVVKDVKEIADAECVIIALPRFAVDSAMSIIKSVLHSGQTLVFIPAPAGLDKTVVEFEKCGVDVIGFQRVPYVARTIEYGKAVWVSDVREIHKLAFSNHATVEKWKHFFELSLGGKIEPLSTFLSFTFSNSNPLLHPARLKVLLAHGNNGKYRSCPYFYAEWTDESSELYVAADCEMRQVFASYAPDAVKLDYESALEHYGVTSADALTKKIRSIDSLKPILAPWKKSEDGIWTPDLKSRYFTEDVPYGTEVIQEYADQAGIDTPVIDSLIATVKSWMIKGSIAEARSSISKAEL